MPWHHWGGNFDFAKLNRAADRMAKVYERITKKPMVWKEKYGTVRYEFTFAWVNTVEDIEVFEKVLKWIIKKYPEIAGELIEDACWCFPDEKVCNFFNGVLYLHESLNPEEIYEYI